MSALRVPHECEPASHLWTAWPDHPDWGEALAGARAEIAAFAEAAHEAARNNGGDPEIVLLTPPDGAAPPDSLREAARVRPAVYGDIWLRDTGPVWAVDGEARVAVRFRFNGWGGKYLYAGDHDVAPSLARSLGVHVRDVDLVAEGGAFEFDGEGAVITTRSCLLDRNRNPGVSASDVEKTLKGALGAERVIWLEEGLARDHTDGHVDTLARFVRPGLVLCQAPNGPQDPNGVVLDDVSRALDGAKDAHGRPIDVVRLPSPGYLADAQGRPKPASHLNFVHVGDTVIVPVYETLSAEPALAVIREAFEDKTVIGLPADALVEEGGAFHCATNAAPAIGGGAES
jgi:agmatine deiminase